MEIPVRQGGMGLESQAGLRGPAFQGGLEQALPFFSGDKGICVPLGTLIGDRGSVRYNRLIEKGSRTGQELLACWT